jgi:hypothetical protein
VLLIPQFCDQELLAVAPIFILQTKEVVQCLCMATAIGMCRRVQLQHSYDCCTAGALYTCCSNHLRYCWHHCQLS